MMVSDVGSVGCFFSSEVMPKEVDICEEFAKLKIKDEKVEVKDKADAPIFGILVDSGMTQRPLTIIASYVWRDVLALSGGRLSKVSMVMEVALKIIGPYVPTISLNNFQLTPEDLSKTGELFPKLSHINLEGSSIDGQLFIRQQSKKEKFVEFTIKQSIASKIFPDGEYLTIEGTPESGFLKV